jgi:hypothetical protein
MPVHDTRGLDAHKDTVPLFAREPANRFSGAVP